MKLLQELFNLKESSINQLIGDMILSASKEIDKTGMSYDEIVERIAQIVQDNDEQGLTSDLTIGSLKGMIKLHVSDVHEDDETEVVDVDQPEEQEPEEASSEEDSPDIISSAENYRVELWPHEQVHIVDGKGKIRLSMPLLIWQELVRNTKA